MSTNDEKVVKKPRKNKIHVNKIHKILIKAAEQESLINLKKKSKEKKKKAFLNDKS